MNVVPCLNGREYCCNIFTGCLYDRPPFSVTGGILHGGTGVGKTIMALALISMDCKRTLIVPPNMLMQWVSKLSVFSRISPIMWHTVRFLKKQCDPIHETTIVYELRNVQPSIRN